MKLNNILSFLVAGVVCLGVACSVSYTDASKELKQKPTVLSMTTSPEIPSQVMFCNKPIDLTRYDMHERFDRELSSFTYFHSTTMLLFKRANRYLPVIEPILKAYGIPDDFKYLAIIESHLDPRSISPANAGGMWQLLAGTAKENGLCIIPTVDERYHVEKSTVAACKYLNKAYKKYGNWATVAASYNGGMGRISGELRKQFADESFDLWLVEETSRYVFRIMAIKTIFEQPYKYGFVFKAADLYKSMRMESVEVTANIPDLAAFAKERGLDYADIKRFNTWLRDRKLITAGRTFTIQLPKKGDLYYKTPNTKVHDPRWVVD